MGKYQEVLTGILHAGGEECGLTDGRHLVPNDKFLPPGSAHLRSFEIWGSYQSGKVGSVNLCMQVDEFVCRYDVFDPASEF